MHKGTIFHFEEDAAMVEAYQRAKETFRYLWREISWERRRIVPALDMACVKTVFADRPLEDCERDDPREHMWVQDFEFDGRRITGTLLNQPGQLESVKQGDQVSFPFEQLTDWIYAISGRAYGAYTVNLMRMRMSPAERRAHDKAWGLDFGDPARVEVIPADGQAKKKGLLSRFIKSSPTPAPDLDDEHPMCINMGDKFKEHLDENPGTVTEKDERGWTMLHHEALAGNGLVVQMLLERGADRRARTADGDLPVELARRMGWMKIVALLG